MRTALIVSILSSMFVCKFARAAEVTVLLSGEKKQNNLVSELLEVSSISKSGNSFPFARASEGWIFVSATCKGKGAVDVILDNAPKSEAVITHNADGGGVAEAVRFVAKGEHHLRVDCGGNAIVEKLVVKAIGELMHCGLGFDPQIKSFGHYDMEFLKKDILPNVTTLIVPSNIQLPPSVIDGWHKQGKRFVAEVGLKSDAKSADEHFEYWTSPFEKAPFLDGIIINEFGMNLASDRRRPDHQERETRRHRLCEDAFAKMRADDRFKDKAVFAYFGGSANLFNAQDTGTTFVRTIMDRDYRVALERYVFERSSEEKSKDALQKLIDGIADWEKHEPGVRQKMVIAFGLFSMPPGGINKLPNVDYHVWMDQQMNVVANHPAMSGIAGLEWWTTILADEETTRFVGKLYRHYGIEGKTEMLTKDPLFMTHLQNADFENGTDAWTLQPAEKDTIQAKRFPRYGRIEGRYMGLGRPADPEHIGDTLLWMKRSEKGPNTFSQTIKDLEPGRLYSLEMFSCDYRDLVEPKEKKMEEANKFIGNVVLDGVDLDAKRSFTEMYPSGPEPKIPIWITYHWKVFRAKGPTAKVTVSDWPVENEPKATFGQEQTFNFLELQPYYE